MTSFEEIPSQSPPPMRRKRPSSDDSFAIRLNSPIVGGYGLYEVHKPITVAGLKRLINAKCGVPIHQLVITRGGIEVSPTMLITAATTLTLHIDIGRDDGA
jgi:hypothetical protein